MKSISLIAEISGNHLGDLARARLLIEAAAVSGATHVKLQTYTPDTITVDSDRPEFIIDRDHPLWGGRKLHELYQTAFTPWEWHKELFDLARSLNLIPFSSPFDPTSVEFLEGLQVELYKIASLESGDLPLIKLIAETGKPIIASTGASSLLEIDELVETVYSVGKSELTLLVCTSAYPTPINAVNLRRIETLRERYGLPVGLSDHTIDAEASIGAVALGATVVERHLTLKRSDGGPDAAFSLEPQEFKYLAQSLHKVEQAMGSNEWLEMSEESESRRLRRSLYVVKNVKKGEEITSVNVRSIRPANGLPPKVWFDIKGQRFAKDVEANTPLEFSQIENYL
jgi:pseudaminic acid synthase